MPKKILIIDDDPVLVKAISSFLQTQGYEIIVAHDGHEGIEQLKEGPDLIILDLQMPKMNGYEFIISMKEMARFKQVPIIVLTVKDGMIDMVKGEGVKEYLIKPFHPDTLLECVHKYL